MTTRPQVPPPSAVRLLRRDGRTSPARLRLIVLLCGWLVASGVPWDILQVAGWTRMWAQNIRTSSFTEALAATFDPDRRCEVCLAVATAREKADEASGAAGKALEKAPIVMPAAAPLTVFAPALASVPVPEPAVIATAFSTAPPVPPPRSAA